jgi:hypothetical protein
LLPGWLAPILFCASLLLLGWSFYNVYVRRVGTRLTAVIAWSALAFVIVFWTWQLTDGFEFLRGD